MRYSLILVMLLMLISCEDGGNEPDAINVEGKWNLEKYTDVDGVEHDKTYTIFTWYEHGFEFVKEQFYPRYDPELRFDAEEWQTNYLLGPGSYTISNGVLTLSYEDLNYNYTFDMLDENTIRLSNKGGGTNPWIGSWVLVRHTK